MKKIIVLAFILVSLLFPIVNAQASGVSGSGSFGGRSGPDAANLSAQENCLNNGGIWIAIGCVDPSPIGILTRLVQIGLGIMGGVAVFQFIMAGVAYQRGDEGKIEEAKEKIKATLTGIAVLVFSVLILRIIGVNVLDVVPSGLF